MRIETTSPQLTNTTEINFKKPLERDNKTALKSINSSLEVQNVPQHRCEHRPKQIRNTHPTLANLTVNRAAPTEQAPPNDNMHFAAIIQQALPEHSAAKDEGPNLSKPVP